MKRSKRMQRDDETVQRHTRQQVIDTGAPWSAPETAASRLSFLVFAALVLCFGSATVTAGGSAGRILAVGDSITAGAGVREGAEADRGYVAQLRRMLRGWVGLEYQGTRRRMAVTNIAVGGQQTADVIQQLSDPALTAKLAAMDIRVVTLTVGGNDLRSALESGALNSCLPRGRAASCERATAAVFSDIGARYRQIVETLRGLAPNADIALIDQYNPFRKKGCNRNDGAAAADKFLAAWNASVVAPTARAFAAHHVQIRQGFLDAKQAYHSVRAGDCLHPSEYGHRFIARSVERALLGY